MFGFDGGGGAGGAGPAAIGSVPAGAVMAPAAAGGGGAFGGVPGLLRMFNDQFGGQIGWLLPAALVSLVTGLWARRRAGRADARLTRYVLWGTWLLVTVVVFSFMSGIIHSYYTVALAPAVAALVGAGCVELWRLRARSWAGGVLLGGLFVGSAALAAVLLERTPDFLPGLGIAVVALAVAGSLLMAAPARLVGSRLALAGATVGLAALLIAPTAYAAQTMATAHNGGDPAAGPTTGRSMGFGGQGGPGGAFGGMQPPTDGTAGDFVTPPSGTTFGTPPSGGPTGSPGIGGRAGGGGSLDQATVDYLVANRGGAAWLVAVSSANEGAPIQLATGIPVMATGGFSGSDAGLSLDRLKAYVASGQLRFVVVDGGGHDGGPGGAPGSSASTAGVSHWVTTACAVATDSSGATLGGGSLYDCAGAAS